MILADDDIVDAADLGLPVSGQPAAPRAPGPATAPVRFLLPEEGLSLDQVERDLVEQALERSGGNKSHAARLLGLTRATLRYRVEKLELE